MKTHVAGCLGVSHRLEQAGTLYLNIRVDFRTDVQYHLTVSKAAVYDLQSLRRLLAPKTSFAPERPRRTTGISELDVLLGHAGLPKGSVSLLRGAPGSGRTSLVAKILGHSTQKSHLVAWIDIHKTLYPPALEQIGIQLHRLLIIQPQPDLALYAAEQLLRSGLFQFVAMSGFDAYLRHKRARRLLNAAQSGESCGLVIGDVSTPLAVKPTLDLHVKRRHQGIQLTVQSGHAHTTRRKVFTAKVS